MKTPNCQTNNERDIWLGEFHWHREYQDFHFLLRKLNLRLWVIELKQTKKRFFYANSIWKALKVTQNEWLIHRSDHRINCDSKVRVVQSNTPYINQVGKYIGSFLNLMAEWKYYFWRLINTHCINKENY